MARDRTNAVRWRRGGDAEMIWQCTRSPPCDSSGPKRAPRALRGALAVLAHRYHHQPDDKWKSESEADALQVVLEGQSSAATRRKLAAAYRCSPAITCHRVG